MLNILKMIKNNTKGQAWIETVVYTLIMLSIIGIVIAVAKPALQEKQDKLFVEQSIESMNQIDSKIGELMTYGPGNTREITELGIKKGKLTINSSADSINFEIDSKYAYSQPDQLVKVGKMDVITEKKANNYLVKLSINYTKENINIVFGDAETVKTLSPAPTPYKMFIRNVNYDSINKVYKIDFTLA
jgi:hypothetical protein